MDMKSPVAVVQEYDRKKKLAGDLGNGFVRFNLSPAKVRKTLLSCVIYYLSMTGTIFRLTCTAVRVLVSITKYPDMLIDGVDPLVPGTLTREYMDTSRFLQGVDYLVEKGMLVYEPRAVATFLLENCDKLDKTQVRSSHRTHCVYAMLKRRINTFIPWQATRCEFPFITSPTINYNPFIAGKEKLTLRLGSVS